MTAALGRIALPGAATTFVALVSGSTVVLVTSASPKLAAAAIGGGALFACLIAKPWASLPLIVLGGAAADRAVATAAPGVTGVVALRALLFALACTAIAIRRLRAEDWGPRVRTPADGPAIVLVCSLATLALWGLALDNSPHQVLVGTYHLMVLPLYFFLATFTLNTPERFWAAARLFLLGAAVYAAVVHLAASGRQGGLFSTFGLVGLLALAGAR